MPQKTIRTLAVFCLLIFLGSSISGCRAFRRLFHKKKPKETTQQVQKPPEAPKPPEETPPAESAPSEGLKPSALPPPSAGAMLPPGMPSAPGMPPSAGIPGAPPSESAPRLEPTVSPPSAPSTALPEVGGAITVFAGNDKNVSEGSYFLIEDAQASSATGQNLEFEWSLADGPADLIQIVQGKSLKGAFKVLDVKDPTPFLLKLTVSDGTSQRSSQVKVTAFPAKLEFKNHLGGITRQVERIGEMTYVSRGRTLEIYDPLMNLVAKTDLESPVMEMAGFSFQSHSYLYALTEAGEWLLLDVTDPKGVGKTTIQKTGAFFKNLRIWEPKSASATPELFITALDRANGMLWSFSDPASPQAKLQLKGPSQDPRKLLLWGKNLYLADGESLSTFDGTNGILTASLPAGGVVTGLDVVERQGKPFLVVSLGAGEKGPGSGDLGLRIFEIGVAGKLGNERRIHLKGNPSVERLHVVPFTTKLLLGVKQKEELSLRVFDLATESEVALDLPADLKFAALFDFATGRLNNIPMAVLADASALRVLKFNPVGNPPTRYKVEAAKTTFSTLAAGGVRMGPGETSVFLLDLGSMLNPLVPALQEIGTADFTTKNTLVLGDGSYLADMALTDRPKFNFAVNLNDGAPASPESQRSSGPPAQTLPSESQPAAPSSGGLVRGSAEGKLRVFATDTRPMNFFLSAARLFGDKKEGNESRPLGIDALINPNGILMATAVGKISGMGLRTGLILIRIPPEGDPQAVLKGDLSQKITYIPLADARDVRLSRDGKWALVAAGIEGLAVVDLEKNKVVIKSNPQQGAMADRVLLSNDQKKVFVSFLSASTIPNAEEGGEVAGVPASMSIFYFDEGKLGIWGGIKGLSSFTLPYGVRAASGALSSDDLYLFVANGRNGVWAYNASDPSSPVLIAKLSTHGIATAVAVGQKYKNIYIADLVNGLEMAEFGF